MYRLFLVAVILLIPLTTFASTKSATKEVEIEAQGVTYQAAINEALVEAISRVHGKSINSEKLTSSVEMSLSDNADSEYFAGEAYQSQIKEKTQGIVLGFDVLKSEQLSENKWSVLLNVKVADYKKSASADRQRIAVLPFKSERKSFKLGLQSINSEQVAAHLSSAIIEKLVTTRKFTILDRDFEDAARNELARIGTMDVAPSELARLSQGLVADYVLVGNIANLNFDITERTMRTSDKKFMDGQGQMAVSFRLIEVATSQIVFSGAAKEAITDKNLPNGVNSSAAEIHSPLISKVAASIVRDTTDQIYPLTVVGKQGEELIISEGSATLKVGQRYEVYRRIEKIIDPYTKEFTGWSEELYCEVEISRTTSRLSYAKVTKVYADLAEEITPKRLMLKQLKSHTVPVKKAQPVKKPITEKESKDW